MKRVLALTTLLIILSTSILAGGGKVQKRHDGAKGKGKVQQQRHK